MDPSTQRKNTHVIDVEKFRISRHANWQFATDMEEIFSHVERQRTEIFQWGKGASITFKTEKTAKAVQRALKSRWKIDVYNASDNERFERKKREGNMESVVLKETEKAGVTASKPRS